MSVVIDHLEPYRRVRVIRSFEDANGTPHLEGEQWLLLATDYPWRSPIATLEVQFDTGERKRIPLAVHAANGPASGRMREYFEVERAAVPPRLPTATPAPPAPAPDLDYAPEIARILDLADAHDFRAADAAFDALMLAPQVFARHLRPIAAAFERAATAASGQTFEWLRVRAISCWQRWASQATSGGEGVAMSHEAARAEKRWDDLRRSRRTSGPQDP